MEFKVDLRHPAREPFGRPAWPGARADVSRPVVESPGVWALGAVVEGDGSPAGPGVHRRSDWAECECPGDCLRDHENE